MRSTYELFSTGNHQHLLAQEQKPSLCQAAGDIILFQNLQLKRPISKYGIWMEGEIVRVFCREKTVQVLCFPSQKNANKTSETTASQ